MSFLGLFNKKSSRLIVLSTLAIALLNACKKETEEKSFSENKKTVIEKTFSEDKKAFVAYIENVEIVDTIFNQSSHLVEFLKSLPDQTYLSQHEVNELYNKMKTLKKISSDDKNQITDKINELIVEFQKERIQFIQFLLTELTNMKVVDKNTKKIQYNTVIQLSDGKYVTVKELLNYITDEFYAADNNREIVSEDMKKILNGAMAHIDLNIGSATGEFFKTQTVREIL